MNKILVVEDEKDIRENLKLLLSAEGYEVITADNGLDAYRVFQTVTPDLIISDIMMPHMNGFELFRKVSEELKAKVIPFIFLTAKNDSYSMRSGMNLGADDYITKPFVEEELLAAINVRLEKYLSFNKRIENVYENISKYVPHELRTPLVAIMGYSQLILSENESLKQNEVMEMTERINFASKRLFNRIEKFIQFTETVLMPGHSDIDETPSSDIDNAIVKEIVFKNYLTKERENDFLMSIEKMKINMPERYVRLIINELLENAVKFSEKGEDVIVSGKFENKNYILKITDHGIGMTPEESNLLGLFKQLNRDVFQQEGNGLGLVIVKNILRRYGGELRINSEKNKSTTITVSFKLVDK